MNNHHLKHVKQCVPMLLMTGECFSWIVLLCCIVVKTTVFLSLFHAMLPCLPRCGSGFSGLKDQGVTNFIVLKFITEYNSLFLKENETSPYDVTLGQVCPSYTHGYQSFQNILGFSEILLLKKIRHFN